MKKAFLAASLTAVTLLGGLGLTPVFAAAGDTADSQATIKFTENDKPTDPIDPGTDTPTGMNGPLSIDLVPALDFGEHPLKTLNSFKDEGTHKLQVTDGRSVNSGWNVTASISDFTKDGDATVKLDGAALSFTTASKLTGAVNGALDDSIATDGLQTFAVTGLNATGGAANVFSGAADKSAGTWQAAYDKDAYTLTVPTGVQTAGTFNATLTWTINDGPAS